MAIPTNSDGHIIHVGHVAYLACADRLTGWFILYHLKPGHATTSKLMSICRHLFQTYSTPDKLSTYSGTLFTSSIFQEFLRTWCVRHRLSSVTYPQSNSWAELAVRTAKRLVNGNIAPPPGSLDNDNVALAILLYQNTLIQGIGLSLAQLQLHCQLCDSIPSQPTLYKLHPRWVAATQCRNELFHHRNTKIIERYNRCTHNLSPLQTGNTVTIQSTLNYQWNTTGKVITALPNRQYWIRVDGLGRITLRNRCFLRKCKFKTAPKPIPSVTPAAITPTINTPLLHPDPPTSSNNDTHTTIDTTKQTTPTFTHPWSPRIPRALSRPHNRSGLKERHSPHTTWPVAGGRRDEEATALMRRIKQ